MDAASCENHGPHRPVMVAAASMGYGHLRAAASIADRLGVSLVRADQPPLTDDVELTRWRRSRRAYESLSRAAGHRVLGVVARGLLNRLTAIGRASSGPDPSRPPAAVRSLDRAIQRGFGRSLAEELKRTGRGLVTTFYAPAIAAASHGVDPVWCVVTDTDIHRIWVAADPAGCPVRYLVPTESAAARLRSYGVPPDRVRVTGFPLPHSLVGGLPQSAAEHNQRRRMDRLTRRRREPIRLMFAVGGAGAQISPARALLTSLGPMLATGDLKLTLVAGARPDLVRRFLGWVRLAQRHGAPAESVEVLGAEDFPTYLARFNRRLADTDVLWTKPSELVFFAALGLPLILDYPLGDHERANRDWILSAGAGFVRGRAGDATDWLRPALENGRLAACSAAGFAHLPRLGLESIVAIASRPPNTTAHQILPSP